MERTFLDIKMTNKEIGKIYFHRCEDNPRYFRSIRIGYNPFLKCITPQISNPIYGEPPEGLEEMPMMKLQRLLSNQMRSFAC
tara:strand:- start:74 stop:319 length:246 start_codon:yes stop_codon:yes gene_type:complete